MSFRVDSRSREPVSDSNFAAYCEGDHGGTMVICARVDIVEPEVSNLELEELAQSLRAELLLLDVGDAARVPAEWAAPAGARGPDAATLGALLVTLESSLPLVTAVVKTIRAWLIRSHAPTRTVRVTVADASIELSAASGEQQDRLVDALLEALAAAEPPR